MAAAALRAQGVDAFLGNGHASAAMPHLTLRLGGLQIMVPTFQLAEAKALLQTRVTDWREDGADVEDDEPASGRNRWRAWVVLFMFIGPGVLAILWVLGERFATRISQWFGG